MSSRVHGGLNIMMRSALRITEARELAADQEAELAELVGIYRQRGVPEPGPAGSPGAARRGPARGPLARRTRTLRHHRRPPTAGRDSLGASFFIGGLLPLLGLLAPTATARLWLIVAVTLIGLAGTHLGRPRGAFPTPAACSRRVGHAERRGPTARASGIPSCSRRTPRALSPATCSPNGDGSPTRQVPSNCKL